jgi:mannose-6-phosphate isomerase-like protein (cupin superfamily)
MKRDPSLARLSRDHQHGLAVALQLRRATSETADAARAAFVGFWEDEGRAHFRAEEDVLLPSAAGHLDPAHPAVAQMLAEHGDIRARAAGLTNSPAPPLDSLHELGYRLNGHIRHEERVVFPLIEAAMPEAELSRLADALETASDGPDRAAGTGAAVDLLGASGTGPAWGMASGDLNATLLVWDAGHELLEHTNDERDVLLIVLEGSVVAVVDGNVHELTAGTALLIEKGRSRSLRVGADGVRYLSVHLRRHGVRLEP